MHPPELVYKIIELAGCGYCGSLVSLWGRPPSAVRRAKPGSPAIRAETHGIRRTMAIVCAESAVRASAAEQIFRAPPDVRQHKPSREAAVRESPARECLVKWKNRRESRRDDTRSHTHSTVL